MHRFKTIDLATKFNSIHDVLRYGTPVRRLMLRPNPYLPQDHLRLLSHVQPHALCTYMYINASLCWIRSMIHAYNMNTQNDRCETLEERCIRNAAFAVIRMCCHTV
jgi:hypothetical protein